MADEQNENSGLTDEQREILREALSRPALIPAPKQEDAPPSSDSKFQPIRLPRAYELPETDDPRTFGPQKPKATGGWGDGQPNSVDSEETRKLWEKK